MAVLFVHGAGGWTEDQPMVRELHAGLGLEVSAPRFPDDDMSAAAWRSELDSHLDALGPGVAVVGHSFGASMALLHAADSAAGSDPVGLVLLAMPFWGSQGWQAEYALPAGAALPRGLPVFLHHCRDDAVVPFGHLQRHAARLPGALARPHSTGGHQFEGRMGAVADDVAALVR